MDRLCFFVEFMGAEMHMTDENTKEYTPRGKIFLNLYHIAGYYDHTILVDGNKVRVMEDEHEIREKLFRMDRM